MADQGKWFKLHCGWDDDPSVDALSDADQLRWVKFGTYMKEHGTEGKIVILEPARNLQNKFRVDSFDAVIEVLKRLPNYDVGEKQKSTVTPVTNITVTIKNWMRYQGDFSRERMRKLRAHVTAKRRGEEKRSRGDVEEKRNTSPIAPPQKSQSPNGNSAVTEFWQPMIDHIYNSWSRKKNGAKLMIRKRDWTDVKAAVNVHQPWGIMALWDVYLTSNDEYARNSGYSVPEFVRQLPRLVDGLWKPAAQRYMDKLIPVNPEGVAKVNNLVVMLGKEKAMTSPHPEDAK